jgi:hypothetical protein
MHAAAYTLFPPADLGNYSSIPLRNDREKRLDIQIMTSHHIGYVIIFKIDD